MSQLLKEFKEKDVQRIRNLIQKKSGNATGIQVGYSKEVAIHKEGDTWEENGKKWTISGGVKKSIPKILKFIQPLLCPNCNKPMKSTFDKKMFSIHGICFDCTIDMEAEKKLDGTWEEYQRETMKKSARDFFIDFEEGLDDFLSGDSGTSYITEQGDVEDWTRVDINTEDIKKQILEQLTNAKEKIGI